MSATVSWYNDIMGVRIAYNPKTNMLLVNSRAIVATEAIRQQLLKEAQVSYNHLGFSAGYDC